MIYLRMKKMNPQAIKPNWGSVEKRSPTEHITSAELAKVLGVHLQTINNWKLRELLPKPESNSRTLRGNKNYYRISKIRGWLENKPEDEINREWLRDEWGISADLTAGQINQLSRVLATKEANQ